MKPRLAFLVTLLALFSACGLAYAAPCTTPITSYKCTPGSNCNLSGAIPPQIIPPLGAPYSALAAGLFKMSNTDLYVPGLMPISITRTYRSEDRDTTNTFISRSFGAGQILNYDIYLFSCSEVTSNTYTDAELVMPDGSELMCQNTAQNINDYTQASFVCAQQPSDIWFGSTLTWNASTSHWNLTRKDKTVYAFGHETPLESITDRYGNSITIARKTSQVEPTCTNPGTYIQSSDGRYVDLCYDGNPSTAISKAVDNSGREVDYAYSYGGNKQPKILGKVTYQQFGGGVYVQYSNAGACLDLSGASLSTGETITWFVSKSNPSNTCLLSEITFGEGTSVEEVSYQYDKPPANQVTVTMPIPVPNGQPNVGTTERLLAFDGNGYLIDDDRGYNSSIQEETSWTRDINTELPCTITDPLGRVTSFLYDQNSTCSGSDITLANVTNITQSNLLNPSGLVTWAFTYDPIYSEITSISDPLQHTTTITIDPATGNATKLTDPIGRFWTATYQQSGQIQSVTENLNSQTTNTTSFGYNSTTKDLASITDPLGNATSFIADSLGRLQSVTTPLRETTSYTYDSLNHVASVTDPNNNTTNYTWDFDGHLTKLIDAMHNKTTWNWTTPNPAWDVTECDMLSQCSDWNISAASGLVESYQDKRDLLTRFDYDALERVSDEKFNNRGAAGFSKTSINFTYDGADRVLSMTDTGGGNPSTSGNTRSFTYDGLNNLLTQSYNAPENLNPAVTYTYDLASRRTSMLTSGQPLVNYGYDNANDVTMVCQGQITNGVCSTAVRALIAYDNADRRKALGLPNGVTVSVPFSQTDQPNGYDAASRLKELDVGANGNPLGKWTYSYDNDGRSTGVGGSLAGISLPAGVSGNLYNTTNQLKVWNGQSNSVISDNANNLTKVIFNSNNTQTFDWDERNQLTDVDSPSDYEYFYDALGLRETADAFGLITGYIWDAGGATSSVSESTGNNAASYLTMPGTGEVFAAIQGSSMEVPLHDVLGSTIGLVDSTGAIVTSYTYEPFGNPTQSGQSSTFPYLYAGIEYDSATGLYHTLARYYSPTLQRFLSEDPIGYTAGDPNIFAYTSNDPVNFSDPSGLQSVGVGLVPEQAGDDVVGPKSGGIRSLSDYVTGASSDGLGARASFGIAVGAGSQSLSGGLASRLPSVNLHRGGSATGLGVSQGPLVLAQDEPPSDFENPDDLNNPDNPYGNNPALEPEPPRSSIPVGRRRNPIQVPLPFNEPAEINGRRYTGHALDEMTSEGLVPSVVEEAIKNGATMPGNENRTLYIDLFNRVTVVAEPNGTIVTVYLNGGR